jgi:enoyl-[acyl-carrier protein] reductase II
VVDAVAPTPVAAAGGIADARGVAAALALGAQAAVLGTRFLASEESFAHPDYKRRLLEADGEDTVKTTLFGHGWPNGMVRMLRTPFVEEWLGRESECQGSDPNEPVVGYTMIMGHRLPVKRFMGQPPNATSEGDLALRSLSAGQSVGLVRDIQPAADIMREIVRDLEAFQRR